MDFAVGEVENDRGSAAKWPFSISALAIFSGPHRHLSGGRHLGVLSPDPKMLGRIRHIPKQCEIGAFVRYQIVRNARTEPHPNTFSESALCSSKTHSYR